MQNWIDWGFKLLAMILIVIVLVTLHAIWRGVWVFIGLLARRKI